MNEIAGVYGVPVFFTPILARGVYVGPWGVWRLDRPARPGMAVIVAQAWRRVDLAKLLNHPQSYRDYLEGESDE